MSLFLHASAGEFFCTVYVKSSKTKPNLAVNGIIFFIYEKKKTILCHLYQLISLFVPCSTLLARQPRKNFWSFSLMWRSRRYRTRLRRRPYSSLPPLFQRAAWLDRAWNTARKSKCIGLGACTVGIITRRCNSSKCGHDISTGQETGTVKQVKWFCMKIFRSCPLQFNKERPVGWAWGLIKTTKGIVACPFMVRGHLAS